MGKPAARLGDMHTCPMLTGTVPHVGGPITGPSVSNVLIGGQPAAVIGDMCTCTGPPDIIAMGSTSVIFGGRFAARQTDNTAHGGLISVGLSTVLIGGPASATSLNISSPNKSRWDKLKANIGIKAGDDGIIKYGDIIVEPDQNNPDYQGKVIADLIMIDNTPTGKKLLKSLNDGGGATIKGEHTYEHKGEKMTVRRNACFYKDSPPTIVYDPDSQSSSNNPTQPWQTRPPAIGLAHGLINADTENTPETNKEKLNSGGEPSGDNDPFTENKIRSEWHTSQHQRK